MHALEGMPSTSSSWASPGSSQEAADWRSIDRALRTIASRRAALDAEEARWLREAERIQIWRRLGMVSALDYMERVLGYSPRTAQDRLRVARALGSLRSLTAALASGQLPFSAVRELTRVATPATEAAWCTAALGKNLRQIEELVADHKPGDRPDDPGAPEARTHVVRFELSAEAFALLRQARQVLDAEHGTRLSDDELITAMGSAVLDGAPAGEPTGRAKFQIAMVVCERCRQGWQEAAGVKVAVSAAMVERASCDAQHIGSLDGAEPERAYQDVPPSVVRFVWRRDGGRCRVPGCRSARGLEVHHLVHRADGGGHDATNLILACSACHAAHHNGLLAINGPSDQLTVARGAVQLERDRAVAHDRGDCQPAVARGAHVGADECRSRADDRAVAGERVERSAHVGADDLVGASSNGGPERRPMERDRVVAGDRVERGAHVGADDLGASSSGGRDRGPVPSKLELAVIRTQAKQALIGLGWKPAIATEAVRSAAAVMDASAPLERWIFEALRRCPRPVASR